MIDFLNLNDFYNYIEKEDIQTRNWEIANGLRRLYEKEKDPLVKKNLGWEWRAFDFGLDDGKLIPLHSNTSEDGKVIYEYPSISEFAEEGIAYLQYRIEKISNPYLKIRYNQILWNSPAKNHQYAKNAVDSCLKIFNTKSIQTEDCWSKKFNLFKNGLALSIQAKHKTDLFKKIFHSWLFDERTFPNYLKIFLLREVIEIPQFKKEDYNDCLDLVKKIGESYKRKKTDYHFWKDIYEIGLKIAQKTGSDTKIWNRRIGDTLVTLAENKMDDTSRMLPLSFLKDALPFYKLAGAQKKIKQVEQRYFEIKKELKLSTIKVDFSHEEAEEYDKLLEARTNEILANSSEEILSYLIFNPHLFPNKQHILKLIKNEPKSFLDFSVLIKFDINHNVSSKNDSKIRETSKLYEKYDFLMRISTLPLLQRTFVEGIKREKITYKTVLDYIYKHAWLGQELVNYDSGGELIKYSWISLIAPSILEYFFQMESALKSHNPPNWILPIDSLTLKFEGALRDFVRLLGVSTTITGKGNILREKYIEELLTDPEITKRFNENDLLFFNYLFVSKDGFNLRNNIAHSFFRFHDYHFHLMHLLICAILKLGQYRMRLKDT
ncbi:DUF4209 domain-containing protein [Chitinophagaceae bacterium MMS25-I14]